MMAGEVCLGLPETTRRELDAAIERAVHEARQAIGKARKSARILRNLPTHPLNVVFEDFPEDEIRGELEAQLEQFLSNDSIEALGWELAKTKEVFALYFEEKPPFEGKKKAEFPDAFTLSIVSEWGVSEDEEVLIASRDKDMEEGVKSFPNLRYVGTLENLLERVARELDELTPAAEKAYGEVEDKVKDEICDRFNWLGFILEDQDGDVGSVKALEAEVDASLLRVEEREDGSGVAKFDVVGIVTYEADLHYDDMTTAVYDKEDGRFLILNTVDEKVTRDEAIQAELTLIFRPGEVEGVRFEIDWNNPRDVNVTSSQWDDWPYK